MMRRVATSGLVGVAALTSACASRTELAPARPTTEIVRAGTTIEALLFEYGVPSRVLEHGRIVTWRLTAIGPAEPRTRSANSAYATFDQVETSLVVVLDQAGRVVRAVAVPVQFPSPELDEDAPSTVSPAK